MKVPAISDVIVKGKRLVVRADLNVPVDGMKVTDDTRIRRFAEGMKPLLAQGARLIILTHFGRPERNVRDSRFSVDKLRPALAKALGVHVRFSDVCVGKSAEIHSSQLQDGEAMLCENLRYHAGEIDNDPAFAAELARLGDVYVNDAFSCAHRAHASTDAIAKLMPAMAGPLLIEELKAIGAALENPRSPAVAIVGGAKVSSKIAVLKNLVQKLDAMIIGGGMANTFLFADGAPMGNSLVEVDQVDTVAEIRALAKQANCDLVLPVDLAVAKEFKAGADMQIVAADKCPEDMMILDAGPASVAKFTATISKSQTVLWNGPLGAFEIPPFDIATCALAKHAAQATRSGGVVSVAGGGDTVSALNAAGVAGEFTYVSSAGGAFLEWLEGKTLPGIAALMQADKAA